MTLADTAIDTNFRYSHARLARGEWTQLAVKNPISTSQVTQTPDWARVIQDIAASGDRQAFARLFEHFAPRVKAYMMRLGSDGASAEELSQEALAAVWRKADQYDPAKAGASTWIFTIARNLRIDAYRKENRPELDPNDPALVPEPDAAADDVVFATQRAQQIQIALGDLPEEQRRVVHLSFYEDRTHADIAAQLDLPLGTVKSRIRLAFQRIRNSLGEDL